MARVRGWRELGGGGDVAERWHSGDGVGGGGRKGEEGAKA